MSHISPDQRQMLDQKISDRTFLEASKFKKARHNQLTKEWKRREAAGQGVPLRERRSNYLGGPSSTPSKQRG